MRFSLHTDVLIDVGESLGSNANDTPTIRSLLEQGDHEFWVPALCVAGAYNKIAETHGAPLAARFLEFIQQHASSVPFRNRTLNDCLEQEIPELESASHLSVNALVPLDAVLTGTLNPSNVGGLACRNPDEALVRTSRETETDRVPFLDLKAQFAKVYTEVDDRFTDIMSNTGFILGKHVEEFEQNFAEAQGAKYCIGVSSGTDALHLAFLALGIGPGDEVVVPVNTFIATAEGVSLTGARPVFVDCDRYYNIDIEGTRRLLEERGSAGRVRAIVPVHLYGQPADLDGVMALADEFSLAVVEDCAQAHLAEYRGKKVGNFGAYGAFSFYPGKNLGAYGEAGALVTNDDGLHRAARMLRAHGEETRYIHSTVGHNYRMEALQGAVLATKIKFLQQWTAARQRNAHYYRELLADVPEVELPEEHDFARSVHHLFVIRVDERDDLREYLDNHGIASGLHYPVPLHLQAAYADLDYGPGDFPVAEAGAGGIVSLPMYPELSRQGIETVCAAIKSYFAQKRGSLR